MEYTHPTCAGAVASAFSLVQTVDRPDVPMYRSCMEKHLTDPEGLRRFTLWLTNQQHYTLRKIAFVEERNISEVARELIDTGLKRRKTK